MHRLTALPVASLLYLSSLSFAHAEVIKYRFVGTVQSDLAFIRQGDVVIGTFQFETNDTPDSTEFVLGNPKWTFLQTAPLAAIEVDYSFASGAPGVSFLSEPSTDISFAVTDVTNGSITTLRDSLEVRYTDTRQLPFSTEYYWERVRIGLLRGQTDTFSSPNLPSDPIDLADFNQAFVQLTFRQFAGTSGVQASVNLSELQLVPEPSVIGICLPFVAVCTWRRRYR